MNAADTCQATAAAAIARLRQQAHEFGYRVHGGVDNELARDVGLAGRWWWTLVRPGWSGAECSPTDWATEDEAWNDAIVAHASELMEP